MPEILNTVFFILIVIGALFLAFRIAGWKMKKACDFIIRDLEEKRALDPASAVELPYCKTSMLKIGLRDYRPKALEQLIQLDVVRLLEDGRYYLRQGRKLSATND
ncbi:MAG: hypothetical protein C0394_01305 [Syntrophus sp. (in: bacteria)]|nr:hypothetical protein [Syntrophus sp. (in: bacteria)]